MPSDLTPTSYVILGLLAVKPWTTYELAQQMGKGFVGLSWLASGEQAVRRAKEARRARRSARAGARASRQASADRLFDHPAGASGPCGGVPTPGAGPVIEFEQMIKVFFMEHGIETTPRGRSTGFVTRPKRRSPAGKDRPRLRRWSGTLSRTCPGLSSPGGFSTSTCTRCCAGRTGRPRSSLPGRTISRTPIRIPRPSTTWRTRSMPPSNERRTEAHPSRPRKEPCREFGRDLEMADQEGAPSVVRRSQPLLYLLVCRRQPTGQGSRLGSGSTMQSGAPYAQAALVPLRDSGGWGRGDALRAVYCQSSRTEPEGVIEPGLGAGYPRRSGPACPRRRRCAPRAV